ncbi:hypothetical protein [Haloferula sp. A504]|uniref:hypothetical protein n=1 Tax=Haloferula sp. A504 TaxID=3373601 RepID=UPI0031C2E506|nr:hypothetical protein [Verrucomicrobiaceae bacterium E54]
MPEPVSIITFAGVAVLGGAGCLRETQARSSGVSDQAGFVAETARSLVARNDLTASIIGNRAEVMSELYELAGEHAQPGWDGAEAPAVSEAVLERAAELIAALPSSVPNPELAVDPDDAAIALEWSNGPHRVFSVSVGESQRMACAGIDGTDVWHNVSRFDGATVPPFVLHGIQKVLG